MRIQLYISDKVRSVDINNKLVTTLLRLLESVAGHVVTDENPDIVHFFGCWDLSMSHAATNIKRRMTPYVYSPLGGLQPWEVDNHKLSKHTQMMAFQRKMTKEAAVVHVGGEMEYKNIIKKKWNTNVRIIENPLVTNDISEDEMVGQMLALYEETIKKHDVKIRANIAEKVANTKEEDETVNSLLREILYARYQLHRGGLPITTLNDLSNHLTKSDIDEDHFAQLLADMKIDKFFARLEYVMESESTLTEGFMPTPMLEDRRVDKIKSSITRY
ncbi:MAG: hypothetical protein IKW98_08285 [Prevotella sp.]|nr:hypothetical protein [Prevotella sp.]